MGVVSGLQVGQRWSSADLEYGFVYCAHFCLCEQKESKGKSIRSYIGSKLKITIRINKIAQLNVTILIGKERHQHGTVRKSSGLLLWNSKQVTTIIGYISTLW